MVRSDVSCYNSGPVPWRGGNKFRYLVNARVAGSYFIQLESLVKRNSSDATSGG